MRNLALLTAAILANAFANISMKVGADRLPVIDWSSPLRGLGTILSNGWILVGAFLLVTNFPLYNLLLQKMRVSLAFPLVTSCAFAIVIVFSALVFKERLAAQQYLGLVLLVLAIWLIAWRA